MNGGCVLRLTAPGRQSTPVAQTPTHGKYTSSRSCQFRGANAYSWHIPCHGMFVVLRKGHGDMLSQCMACVMVNSSAGPSTTSPA